MRLAIRYQFHATWSVAVALEHTGFNVGTLLTNPEIRLLTLISSLSFSPALRKVRPYGRLGVGFLSQGTRRVRIREGDFDYGAGFSSFA